MQARAATWTVHTEVFEGPLDLLLYLVRRDGIDLKRLSVSRIANAYLDYLEQLRELNLSIAGDYLVMAATLIHLKSLDLLPRLPTALEEEEEDPRAAFARQLADYQRYKDAAAELDARPMLGRDQYGGVEADEVEGELDIPFDAFGLLEMYRGLLAKADEPEPEVRFELEAVVRMPDAAVEILSALADVGGTLPLSEILARLPNKAARVVSFICTLEMLKLHWVRAIQRTHLGEIELTALVTPEDADMSALTGMVEVDPLDGVTVAEA